MNQYKLTAYTTTASDFLCFSVNNFDGLWLEFKNEYWEHFNFDEDVVNDFIGSYYGIKETLRDILAREFRKDFREGLNFWGSFNMGVDCLKNCLDCYVNRNIPVRVWAASYFKWEELHNAY